MTKKFKYFVVFADMRTGSNLLESHLNTYDDILCVGEAFNPNFIGYPNRDDLLGISDEERDRDPMKLLYAIRDHSPEIVGFRFFHDHDPRVLKSVLPDPDCAKIILARNPLDSYVSWKIARATDQWKLTNVAKRKEQKIEFDLQEFTDRLQSLQHFQKCLLQEMQKSGQTYFYITYDDLKELDIVNGLASYIGSQKTLDRLGRKLKPQNPQPLKAKVKNYAKMRTDLASLDPFIPLEHPNFEPRRGPSVPHFVAAKTTPLLFMPIPSGPFAPILKWMAKLDRTQPKDLQQNFSQNTLRMWKNQHPLHRSFTVLRHPVARVHQVFCDKILPEGESSFSRIKRHLKKHYGLILPPQGTEFNREKHASAFKAFLRFLRANLNGQTNFRIDSHWASQSAILTGFAGFSVPDQVIREDQLKESLAGLCNQIDLKTAPQFEQQRDLSLNWLDGIYDSDIEAWVQEIYHRDYTMFGFKPWR